MDFLGKNIKYLRKKNKLKQDDIASIVGKTRTLVSAWENDDRDVTTEDIIKLANHFGIPMDTLIGVDLKLKEENNQLDKTQILFDKYKDHLTESDRQIINTIIEQRKKEIDKERGED